MIRIIFAICLLAFGISADQCPSINCPSALNSYIAGNVYLYKFDSFYQIQSSPDNSSDTEETNGKISGTAKIFASEACSFTIQLDKVNVISSKDNLKKSLQSHEIPLRFGLNANGDIEPNICADITDNEYSLNLKRSIVSLFSMSDRKVETDIFGVCTTDKTNSNGKQTTHKNLNKCSHREQFSLIRGIVNENSGIKSTPLLHGSYTRESDFNNQKFLTSVHLNEVYRLGHSTKSLVKVKVSTSLKFDKSTVESAPKISNGKSASIMFESPKNFDSKNLDILKKQLKKTVDTFNDFVEFGSTENFVELLRLMRHASTESLSDLAGLAETGLVRKIYLDALFRTGTSKSLGTIIKLIPKMNDQEKKMAYLSFYLVEDVTKEFLKQASALLTTSAPKESYLAMGHLISRFCSKRNSICDGNSLAHVTKKFNDSLKKCRVQTKVDEDRILFTLKGIQNSHNIALSTIPSLIQCSQHGSTRIRIAALQAFSSASCNAELQEKSFGFLENTNEDSEIRIESYLAVINCPSNELASKLEKLINNEQINQVGNFISSHLRALKESTDPSREFQKYYLQNIRVTKKFDVDWRRFSFTADNSFSIESLGIGASSDINVIYGLHGYLPRSLRWNVTAEIFGNEVNVWDLSLRQENLEQIVDNLLNAENKNRHKRGIKEESEIFLKKYKQLNKDLSLDLSLKFFGSEMFFLSMDNFESFNPKNILMPNLNDRKLESHNLFLDAKILYPTGLGFPLELSANGMAANKILFDFQNKDNTYNLKLIPSFDISIQSALSIDFQAFKKGIKVSSIVHSATGVDAELKIEENTIEHISSMIGNFKSAVGNWTNKVKRSTQTSNEKFAISLSFPRNSLDILQFKHTTSFTHLEPDKEEKRILLKQKKKRSTQDQCFEQLLVFGAKICYRADIVDYDYADFSLRLNLEKKISLIGSHIIENNKQSFVLIYDTPESKEQHTTKLTASFGLVPDQFCRLEVEFANIKKLFAFEFGLKNNNNEAVLYLQHSDNSQATTYKAGISKSANEYYPILEVDLNGQKHSSIAGYRVSGKIILNEHNYLLENIELITSSDDKTNINGELTVDKDKFSTDLKLNGKTTVKGTLDISGNPGYKIGLFVDNNGGEIFFKSDEGNVQLNVGDKCLKLTGKFNKDEIDGNLLFTNKNVKEAEIILNGKKKASKVELTLSMERPGKSAGLSFKFEKEKDFKGRVFFNRHFIDAKGKLDGNKISGQIKTSSGIDFSLNGLVGDKWSFNDHSIDIQGKIKYTQEDPETHLHLKSSANNEKYFSEINISKNNIEYISWSGDVHVPIDKPVNAKGALKIKDFISTSISFKFNSKNGRGESSVLVSAKELSDKIKVDVKFLKLLPKFEIESTVTFGSDKKYSIKSENFIDKTKFSSKSNVFWLSKDNQIQLDMNGNLKSDELQGDFTLTIPEKEISGKFSKKTYKNGGTIDFNVKNDKQFIIVHSKFEKHGKNKKYNINVDSTAFKLEGVLQKVDDIYSYNFKSGNIHTSGVFSPKSIDFKWNEFQINVNRDETTVSISIHNQQHYVKSKFVILPNKFVYTQESSFDKVRSLKISFEEQKNKIQTYLSLDETKYGLELVHEPNKLELLILTPNKTSRISTKAEVRNQRKSASWSIEIEDLFEFSGKHIGNYDLEDLKKIRISFNIEIQNKHIYQLDITSQDEKFIIDIQNNKNSVVKGSINYAVKQETQKSYIEGQGELLVGGKATQANFKILHQLFTTDIDAESGVKISFTGNFDDRTTINFVKLTDREFHGKFCLCDQKKECANVELESRDGKVLAIVDLKTFGVPYEFDLKSNINQEIMFDARLIDRNNKEVYKVSSGISTLSQKMLLKIHSKEFSIQATTKIPANGLYGYFEEHVEFGFDKADQTKLILTANIEESRIQTNVELVQPQIKTLAISTDLTGSLYQLNFNGKIIIDVFDQKNKEIVFTLKCEKYSIFQVDIISTGLNIKNKLFISKSKIPQQEFVVMLENNENKVASVKVGGSLDNLFAKASILESDILEITSILKPGVWKGFVNIVGKEHVLVLENNGKHFKIDLQLKGVANSEAVFIPNNKMSVKVSDIKGLSYGGKISLEKGKFLESKAEGSIDNLKAIWIQVKSNSNEILNQLETKFDESSKKIGEYAENHNIIKHFPDYNKVITHYENKLNEIYTDIVNDFGPLSNIFHEYKSTLIFIIERINRYFNDIHKIVFDFNEFIYKIFKNNIIPALKSILKGFEDVLETIISALLKKMENVDFSQYIKLSAPFIESLTEFLSYTFKELSVLYKEYEEFIKNIPTLDDVISKYNDTFKDLKLTDQILEVLQNLLSQIKSMNPESSQFCDKLYIYIKQKLTGENVDDVLILGELLDILKKIIPYHGSLFDTVLPEFYFGSLPKTSFSIFKLIESMPIIYNLRLTGHTLLNGFITFDGRFLSYNKNCKFLLVQDSVNNNFSIFANYKNGILKSLTIIDKISVIDITENGLAKINGKNVDWPIVISGEVKGYKGWSSFNIKNKDVEINCTPGLKHCHISVSYLYTGILRGVLGNGNGEKYDDLILPDGQIADSEDKFLSSYGISACEKSNVEIHSQNNSCSSLFAWNSNMAAGFPFISPEPYKKACELIPKCDVASVYVSAAHLRKIPALLPFECLICDDNKEFGEEFPVKVPNSKADVVFIVDLDVSTQILHDLVVPTISDIQKDLKDRNFVDVNQGVIGYSTKYSDPLIITGNIENVVLNEPKLNFIDKIMNDHLPKADEKAFDLAMKYPFRALATKTIIVIRGDGLVLNLGNIGRAVLYAAEAEARGILLQVVQPIAELNDDIIGFNNKLTVPLKGPKDAKRRQNIKYSSNVSIDNVLQSGGWVFDLNKFKELSNEGDRKSFVHQLTSAVSENLFRTEITGNCKCLSNDGLRGTNSCIVTKTVNTTKKVKSGRK